MVRQFSDQQANRIEKNVIIGSVFLAYTRVIT